MREKKINPPPQKFIIGDERAVYQIRVKGLLDERWSGYLSGFTITHHTDDISVLLGTVRDQAALFGILLKIRDLGIPLLAVEQMDDMPDLPS
jgi:hypothetical protein